MHIVYLLAFTIPLISIIAIGLYQIMDEMKKKKFILERRQASVDQAPADSPRRRYADGVRAGAAARHPKAENSESATEVPVV